MIIVQTNFLKVTNNHTTMFENSSTIIQKCYLSNMPLIIKSTTKKSEQSIHETFVGLACTNKLARQIPNFSYIYGYIKNTTGITVIKEHIEGQTLFEYI